MKSVFGLNENFAAALSYILGPFSGIFMLIAERENKFVRFHALQSTLWFLFLWVVRWVIGVIITLLTAIPVLGFFLGLALGLVVWAWRLIFVSSRLFLMARAALSHEFKLPYVGDAAWNHVYR